MEDLLLNVKKVFFYHFIAGAVVVSLMIASIFVFMYQDEWAYLSGGISLSLLCAIGISYFISCIIYCYKYSIKIPLFSVYMIYRYHSQDELLYVGKTKLSYYLLVIFLILFILSLWFVEVLPFFIK